jgi:SNF2 family DNA or RNA helicase
LILATGTPTKTNVEDAYGLIKLLDEQVYGSKANFDWEHCMLLEGAKYRKVIEYKNLDKLHKSLFARARRMTKQQVFKEMPKRVTTFIDVTLSKPHKVLYDKLVDERMLELEDTLIDVTTQQALYQMTQRILLSPDKFTDKPIAVNQLFVEIDEIVEELQGRKLVIFAWYKQSCTSLMQRYANLNPVLINGVTTSGEREQVRKTFINDPDCKLFIANWNSGGEGLDGLQYVSSHVVFAEVCPHPGAYEQAVSRLERSGQTESVNVYILVPKGTIAVKLKKDLLRKDYLTNEVIKDKKVLLRELRGDTE